jgi:hypothetical protein
LCLDGSAIKTNCRLDGYDRISLLETVNEYCPSDYDIFAVLRSRAAKRA